MRHPCEVIAAALALVAVGAVAAIGANQPAAIDGPSLADARHLERDWSLDGSGAWVIRDGLLALFTAGTPAGGIRRPSALAILNGDDVGDVTLHVELRSTAAMPEVTPRRDVLLVVGYQSPTRFYYVHISAARDAVHNGIFLVDNADRRRIDE